MEEFLLSHAVRHQALVRKFVPHKQGADKKESSTNIVVATRIRPMLENEISSGQVIATFPRRTANGVMGSAVAELQPLLPFAWEGNVATLFAHGQTGSGKTFTINGLKRHIAQSLFDGTLSGKRGLHITIFELICSTTALLSLYWKTRSATLKFLAQERSVGSTTELLQLIEYASTFRQNVSTEKNDVSSRTYEICRMRIENLAAGVINDGILYLVDLAGSEVARDMAQHTTDRVKETHEINMSLSVLNDCIRGLADISAAPGETSKRYIPFRRSMLTKLLKHLSDPVDGRDCRTVMLACVNPSFLDTGATKNTLRYVELL
ncbi:hypothetical protein N7495_007553 [Penicillium taxi]|uniref:uncharacterized protein n=1 Tax=Penicillium taxi TaxID=168475 RepID=UPI00254593E0|nr:uncharacterized protein N7495_007553 [Penicillium taxi]KAJ5887512.1 hypothetical protein N7495_007553 [Penicillium taxi]